jgi:hypothetical protein
VSATVDSLGWSRIRESRVCLVTDEGTEIDLYESDAIVVRVDDGERRSSWGRVEDDPPDGCRLWKGDRVLGSIVLSSGSSAKPSALVVVNNRRGENFAVFHDRSGQWERHSARLRRPHEGLESRPSAVFMVAIGIDVLTLPVQLGLLPVTIYYLVLVGDGPMP